MAPTIDLSGQGGNAFALLNMAQTWAKQLGMDPKAVYEDMTSGDYEHLLSAMEKAFPYVGLEFINDPRDPNNDEEEE